MDNLKKKFDEINDTCRFCRYANFVSGFSHDIYECRISSKSIMETKNDMFLILTREQGDTLDLDTCFRCIYYEKREVSEGDKKDGLVEEHLCNLRGRSIWKIRDRYYGITKTNKVYCEDRNVRTSD